VNRSDDRETARLREAPERGQPPIADYALIGDCRAAALVSRAGSIDWLCLPHFSSPSIFAALLDPDRGGSFSIRPRLPFTATRRYLDGSPVLETTFTTESGVVRVLDFLPILDGIAPMRPMRELLRIIEGCAGKVDLEISIDPRPNYGRTKPRLENRRGLGWAYTWLNEVIVVRGDVPPAPADTALGAAVAVRKGERYRLSLSYSQGDPAVIPPLGDDADERLRCTLAWWREWHDRCTYDGPYRGHVLRSALVLKLLSYSLSGAIIAAPTTSLPEVIGGDRNWDYRYCWLRDAGLTMQALVGLGYQDDARSFLSWLLHATRLTWPELQVLYDVYGRTSLQEQELVDFEGYRGSRPVRIGNGAFLQRQLDIYGEVVVAADTVVSGGGTLDRVEARMLAGLAKTVCRQWREPDSGIWEIRGPRRQYTFSKVMCWAALDRLLKLHDRGAIDLGSSVEQFRRDRVAIADTIERRGFNPAISSYTSELDGNHMDASLLLMASVGYKDARHPHMLATYNRVCERLSYNGLLYRYEPGYTGHARQEAAFGICSFWPIDHLTKRGDIDAAEKMFEHLVSFANDLGLFGEEIDPDTGSALGNFPQAFTHVGLINAALAIESARSGR
jgi:GH15 family glucan-1,4-alpha-glucosidase